MSVYTPSDSVHQEHLRALQEVGLMLWMAEWDKPNTLSHYQKAFRLAVKMRDDESQRKGRPEIKAECEEALRYIQEECRANTGVELELPELAA